MADLDAAARAWTDDGFVILPAYLPAHELAPALAELPVQFPTADAFHDRAEPDRVSRFEDEFGGIDDFPFASSQLSLLAVHESLVDLAERLLGAPDLRVYSIEAWAKYTGAADYEQHHHRDYLAHSLVAPSSEPRFGQVEMFVYLVDVPPELGPPAYVPRPATPDLPALPNWYPPVDGISDPENETWVSEVGTPGIYDAEVSGAGPAGTVVAYTNATFHRGTQLTAPRGARYTLHVNFRPAGNDWNSRHSWQQHANSEAWHAFVALASPRQLALFGWPPPGHPYWTEETLTGTQQRYPKLDISPWRPR